MREFKEKIDIEVSSDSKGERIDNYLVKFFKNETRNYIQKLITEGCIEIEGKDKKIKTGEKLKGNEKIKVYIPKDKELDIKEENIPIDIVYEDKDIAVINKDPGITVHPAQEYTSGTLVNAILYHIKDLSTINGVIRPGIVHRLDKDTSGLIIIAKNDKAHNELARMFKDKEIEKRYLCICKGNFKNKIGRIENFIGRDPKDRKKMGVVENGKIAITNYKIIDEVDNFSLVEVRIETGRTHQIRVHMRYLNHPIVGDSVYGNPGIAKRQMLHSYYLKFRHPITKKELLFIGDLKEDFKEVLGKLKLNIKIKEMEI